MTGPSNIHGLSGVQGAQPQAQGELDPTFRRLLDSLEQHASSREASEPAAHLSELGRDLEKADDEFRAAMELRQKLEAAWRQRRGI